MKIVWKLLDYLPRAPVDLLKRQLSFEQRMRWRRRLGGGAETIPDTVVTVADGRRFHIGPDYIYLPLHRGRDFEPEATSVVRRLVGAGDVVLDVGANYGWYTTLFAGNVGPGGQVVAFEPVPTTFERLLEHLELNGCADRVAAVRSAVGDRRADVDVYTFDRMSHACSSLSSLGYDDASASSTPMLTLDGYLREHGIDRVDFLKCDVEGAELMVLQGARALLRSPDAPMVLIELNDETSRAFGYSRADLWALLEEAGFDAFYLIDGVETVRRIAAVDDTEDANLLLCCKGDAIASRLGR